MTKTLQHKYKVEIMENSRKTGRKFSQIFRKIRNFPENSPGCRY